MEQNGTPYISPRYQRQDYLNLRLNIASSAEDFETAIIIFRDRISGRFLQQIHSLENNINRNGFAIMALECLLVETFAQFASGRDNNEGVSKQEYTNFLVSEFSCFTSMNIANKFYSFIRCGILHQAQTKKQSALVYGEPYIVNWSHGFLRVSVDRFVDMMDWYFEDYCQKLRDPSNITIRTNFINKMNYICNR